MSKENVTRRISIYVNGKEVENSLKAVDGAALHLRNQLRQLDLTTVEGKKKQAELSAEYQKATQKQTEYREELGLTKKALDDSAGSFSKLRDGLLSGDLATAKEGLSGIKSEMIGLVKTSLAFIATPWGATLAVLAGIGLVAREWFNYNESIKENTRLIENLTGKTGEAVAEIRVHIQALTDTFDIEFKTLANAVDNLMDTGVAKTELEALEKIKNGLLTAPDKNEFITSLESSALTAKQVGLTLEQVIALKKEIEATGVDPEASFGALQKAAKNLSQQTEVLKTQMRDALGAAFADDILAKVKSGEITITQALIAIGEKAKEMGLNQKQQMDLTVSLLGKQGLAAGGLLVVTKELTDAQNAQTEALTPLQQATKDLADSQLELQIAQDNFLRSDGFETWKSNALIAINAVKKGFLDYANNLFNGPGAKAEQISASAIAKAQKDFEEKNSKIFEDYITKRQKAVGATFSYEIEKENYLASLRSQHSKLISWDATDAQIKKQQQLEAQIDFVKKYQGDVKKITTDATADEVRDAKSAADKIANAQKAASDKKKALKIQEEKDEMDRAIALANAKANLAKAELAFFIANERSKLDATKALTPEIIQEETARLERINDKQQNALADERLAKIEKLDLEKHSAEELVALKQAIDYEYQTNQQALELGFQVSTDALKKQYLDEQKVLKAEQLLADNELALAEATSKEEEDALKRQFQYDKEKADYKKLLDDKKITQDEYNRFIVALDKKKEEDTRLAKIQSVEGQLQEMGKLADATIAIFGQNKAAASAMALINGGLAVTEILKTPSTFPEPFASISRGIQIAGAIATSLRAVAQINKAKPPTRAKFFYGGDTGSHAALGYDEYGPMTGIVHKNEYVIPEVMTQSPRYANTIAWLEQERTGRKINKYVDGGSTSPGTIPNIPTTENNNEMNQLLSALLFRLNNPITPPILFGYDQAKSVEDLNKERSNSTANGTLSD